MVWHDFLLGLLVMTVGRILVEVYIRFKMRSRLRLTKDPTWVVLQKPADGTPADSHKVPHVILQTYHDIRTIPSKVAENLERYAPNYERRIYNDADAKAFLESYFVPEVYKAFRALTRGPHKADLLRYCLLYVHGGVYLDIKTELVRPLDGLFADGTITTILSRKHTEIYQGVIAAPPRQVVFLALIDGILRSGHTPLYPLFLREFMRYIEWDTGLTAETVEDLVALGAPLVGRLHTYKLYKEVCTREASHCYDGLDQHGYCCHIQDPVARHGATRIIKTRYSDYPWRPTERVA